MTVGLLAELNGIRKKNGCKSDDTGTQKFAAAWSKKVAEGEISVSGIAAGALKDNSEWPRHKPLLDRLAEKYKARGFRWRESATPTSDGRKMLQFVNYPGADKGYMLTLADLLVLPADSVDQYAEALYQAHKHTPRKVKYRRGAGRFNGFVEGARCGGWA